MSEKTLKTCPFCGMNLKSQFDENVRFKQEVLKFMEQKEELSNITYKLEGYSSGWLAASKYFKERFNILK